MLYKLETFIFQFIHFISYVAKTVCFIFEAKRKMLHSGMKWSCFIVRRFYEALLSVHEARLRRMKRHRRAVKITQTLLPQGENFSSE